MKHNTLKRKITFLSLLAMTLSLSKIPAQILTNGGFENWSAGPFTFLDPDGWTTNNGDVPSAATVIQGAPRTGSHSVSLISQADSLGGFVGGSLQISYVGAVKPLSLSGYWKGTFDATPTEGITIDINVADTTSTICGTGSLTTPASTNIPNWTAFTLNINYTNSLTLLYTSVNIALSSNSVNTNGQLDDLTMTYAVGIDEIISAHFPSAVLLPDAQSLNHILYVDLLAPQSFQMNIYNIDGKRVYVRDFNLPGGHHEFPVPTENLSKGMYVCNITGNGMQRGIKFVK
jgi:hypothetical protein